MKTFTHTAMTLSFKLKRSDSQRMRFILVFRFGSDFCVCRMVRPNHRLRPISIHSFSSIVQNELPYWMLCLPFFYQYVIHMDSKKKYLFIHNSMANYFKLLHVTCNMKILKGKMEISKVKQWRFFRKFLSGWKNSQVYFSAIFLYRVQMKFDFFF